MFVWGSHLGTKEIQLGNIALTVMPLFLQVREQQSGVMLAEANGRFAPNVGVPKMCMIDSVGVAAQGNGR
jgi:hypothetical protein